MRIFRRTDIISEPPPPGTVRAASPAAGAPRPLAASATKINLSDSKARSEINRPTTRAWQKAAWDYYDILGEVKFGFNLIGAIMSRLRIYVAIVEQVDAPPVEISLWLKKHETMHSESISNLAKVSEEAMLSLENGFVGGGIPELLRVCAMNIGVAGEFFFISPKGAPPDKKWRVASVEELRAGGTSYEIRPSRDNASDSVIHLPDDSYVARVWRSHPRWSAEPESSMLGVLDQAEKLVMFDRVMRTIARSRMHAGAMFIPDGITVKTEDTEPDMDAPEIALMEGLSAPTMDEGAMTSIVPVFLVGPAEQGKEIKRIDLGREIDPEMVAAQQDALNRTLSGLDFPKDLVTGLADVKYANAIVIDDNLYKAHVEPLALLLVDSFTTVFLRPILRKAGVPEALIEKTVIWYDPSEIVTKPDRSSAANEGLDRKVISEKAWRDARGFADTDAPSEEELLRRAVLDDGQIPQEIVQALLELFVPKLFQQMQQMGQQSAGMPATVTQALNPGSSVPTGTPGPEDEPAPMPDDAREQDTPPPDGNLPPFPGRP